MTSTPHLALPLIAAAQAQKHVTHNEALMVLDALTQLTVISASVTAPPGGPAEGQRYIVPPGATGLWAGQTNKIAAFYDNAWRFYAPEPGWTAYNQATSKLLTWNGTVWAEISGGSATDQLMLGVNTTADANNRLAVKANGILFSHDNVTPGTGDLRLTLNKSLAGRDASVTFQDGFSSRALVGLLGDDNFAFKVSADGATYKTALTIDRSTGAKFAPSGGLVMGHNAFVDTNHGGVVVTPFSQVLGPGADASFLMARFGNTASAGRIFFAKSRGATVGSHLALIAGDEVGAFSFAASNGTSMAHGATIKVNVTAAPGAFWAASRITFETSDGASVPNPRLDIGPNGNVAIGTTSDAGPNRLLVSGSNALFTNPSGSFQAAFNKNLAGNDASFVFQSGFSGRALLGLLGDDNFTFKVSADGTAYKTAMVLDRTQGTPRFPEATKFSAYVNFDKYLAADTWTNVGCNVARHNDQADFDPLTGKFTAPSAGVYRFHGRYRFKVNTTAPTQILLRFSKNGSVAATAADQPFANSITTVVSLTTTVDLQADMKLGAGDTVEMQAFFSGSDGYVEANANSFDGILIP